jgi:hypothetical protein
MWRDGSFGEGLSVTKTRSVCALFLFIYLPSNVHNTEQVKTTAIIGIGREDIGADEDDFHTFKRRKTEVEDTEKQTEKLKRLTEVGIGAHSGSIVKTAAKPAAKKVIFF